jgi:hypothetical protein
MQSRCHVRRHGQVYFITTRNPYRASQASGLKQLTIHWWIFSLFSWWWCWTADKSHQNCTISRGLYTYYRYICLIVYIGFSRVVLPSHRHHVHRLRIDYRPTLGFQATRWKDGCSTYQSSSSKEKSKFSLSQLAWHHFSFARKWPAFYFFLSDPNPPPPPPPIDFFINMGDGEHRKL